MFNYLVNAGLKNRLFVLALAAVLMVYGALTLLRMPVDVFPDLNRPTVTLMTEAGGMAPEEVEQLITFPLETTMNGMPGVTAVRSVSSVGLSFLYVQFDWGMDLQGAPDGIRAAESGPRADAGGDYAIDGTDFIGHGRNHAHRHPD